jgi:hypothetical protein
MEVELGVAMDEGAVVAGKAELGEGGAWPGAAEVRGRGRARHGGGAWPGTAEVRGRGEPGAVAAARGRGAAAVAAHSRGAAQARGRSELVATRGGISPAIESIG